MKILSGQLNHVKENNMIKRTVKEIAEFFGVDVGVERGGICLFAPLFSFGELSSTLISDFSNYKEGDIIKPSRDIKE